MTLKHVKHEIFIQGLTSNGRTFRPSDWAERLCGVMSCFRPDAGGPQSYLQYSPYCRPIMVGGIKCVVIDERIRDIEPMALKFVLDFANDNDLQVVDACVVPEPQKPATLSK